MLTAVPLCVVISRRNVIDRDGDSKRLAGYKYGPGWSRTGYQVQHRLNGGLGSISGRYAVRRVFRLGRQAFSPLVSESIYKHRGSIHALMDFAAVPPVTLVAG